jgi:hypothetical protein
MSVTQKVGEAHPVDQTSDRLAALLERRSELEGELKVVSAPESTRTAAAAALASAEAALAELDRSERAAWIAWSENPDSEQPAPRHEERRRLEQRRALGVADIRAADAAISAVQGRLIHLSAQMRQLGPQIYACLLEDVLAQVPEIERQILESHKLMYEQLSRLRGLHIALAEEKAAALNRGDEASAMRLQEALADVDIILTKAHCALKQHRDAEASGDRLVIAAARSDLMQAQSALLRMRAETDAVAGIAKAMLAPRRLGSSGWLR